MTLHLKLFIIIFLVFITNCIDCDTIKYDSFLESFKILKPQTDEEYQIRFQIYCQKYFKIIQTNQLQLGYKLKQHRWMDRKDEQLQSKLYVTFFLEIFRVKNDSMDIILNQIKRTKSSKIALKAELPQNIDYRTTNDVSKIKDQGYCGCCWAFGTIGLYQSWMMFKGQKQYDLSQQYILECTNQYTKNVMKLDYESSCNGGYPYYSGHLLRAEGVPLQTEYPYINFYQRQGFKKTQGICQAKQTYVYGGNPQKIKYYFYQDLSDDELKGLLTLGPVGAQIYANSGFMSYSSGVYSGCPQNSISQRYRNHYVNIIGYDSNGNWIIKNSWGVNWGEDGFGIVSKNNDCALKYRIYQYQSQQSAGNNLIYNRGEVVSPKKDQLFEYLLSFKMLFYLVLIILFSFQG